MRPAYDNDIHGLRRRLAAAYPTATRARAATADERTMAFEARINAILEQSMQTFSINVAREQAKWLTPEQAARLKLTRELAARLGLTPEHVARLFGSATAVATKPRMPTVLEERGSPPLTSRVQLHERRIAYTQQELRKKRFTHFVYVKCAAKSPCEYEGWRHPIDEWLRERYGKAYGYVGSRGLWAAEDDPRKRDFVMFGFKDASAAFEFKMRWG